MVAAEAECMAEMHSVIRRESLTDELTAANGAAASDSDAADFDA